ncbi:hypothetical protein AAHA92_09873 [Salvia divinorum]|uniref:Uncharacterized protein n=1 Tax=Salvia divinorum TaxID=28513 RepID=A0ABD1HWA4_SALDI
MLHSPAPGVASTAESSSSPALLSGLVVAPAQPPVAASEDFVTPVGMGSKSASGTTGRRSAVTDSRRTAVTDSRWSADHRCRAETTS